MVQPCLIDLRVISLVARRNLVDREGPRRCLSLRLASHEVGISTPELLNPRTYPRPGRIGYVGGLRSLQVSASSKCRWLRASANSSPFPS